MVHKIHVRMFDAASKCRTFSGMSPEISSTDERELSADVKIVPTGGHKNPPALELPIAFLKTLFMLVVATELFRALSRVETNTIVLNS